MFSAVYGVRSYSIGQILFYSLVRETMCFLSYGVSYTCSFVLVCVVWGYIGRVCGVLGRMRLDRRVSVGAVCASCVRPVCVIGGDVWIPISGWGGPEKNLCPNTTTGWVSGVCSFCTYHSESTDGREWKTSGPHEPDPLPSVLYASVGGGIFRACRPTLSAHYQKAPRAVVKWEAIPCLHPLSVLTGDPGVASMAFNTPTRQH